jgi:hypothetical protein
MLDITSACIVPSLPSFYPIFNAVYRRVYGISSSLRDIASMHSSISRAKSSRSRSRLDRHDTANTANIDLDDVYGSLQKNNPKSVESGDVGLLDTTDPERPSDVPENYVRQVPIVRMREPKKPANEVEGQQRFDKDGDDHV